MTDSDTPSLFRVQGVGRVDEIVAAAVRMHWETGDLCAYDLDGTITREWPKGTWTLAWKETTVASASGAGDGAGRGPRKRGPRVQRGAPRGRRNVRGGRSADGNVAGR